MAHHVTKSSHARLVDRLNRFPQGAPPSDLLFKILKILFTEKEAGLVSLLPIKPFTVDKAARIWKMDVSSSRKILESLAQKAIWWIWIKMERPNMSCRRPWLVFLNFP